MIKPNDKPPLKLRPDLDIEPIAYYQMSRKAIDKRSEECIVLCRAGRYTMFDDMIAINKHWIFKSIWTKKYGPWYNYYILKSKKENTRRSQTLEIYLNKQKVYLYGRLPYSDLNYFFIFRKKSIQIFVFKGSISDMIKFWGKMKDRFVPVPYWIMENAISDLMEKATEV